MGKSSSSVKKKRSMVSSPARMRKRSKSRTRKSKKFKKLRGRRRDRDDSVSYSSDSDDPMSWVAVSYSSSEDDYKGKRSRSRVRKDVKGRRNRARRRSSSYESNEDSRPVKKQKGSKKTDDSRARKKSDKRRRQKKKKSKREASVGSVSSRSWSCSTCQGESSGSDEGEVEMNRSRLDRKGRVKRRLEKVKSGSKCRRSRSRSQSSCSCSESSGYRREEKLTGEVNPRRLKSVITVLQEETEDRGMDKDKCKEEMIYDYDDCPPCRSNDSNDGVCKRDLVQNSDVASEKKRHLEDEERGEAFISDMRTSIVAKNDKDSEGQYNRSNSGCYGVGKIQNNAVEYTKNEDSGGIGGPSGYDLETILRQKALEKFRTFRKGNQPDAKAPVDQKDPNECDVKAPSTTNAEFYQHKSPKGGDARVMGASQVFEQNSTPAVTKSGTDFAHKKISGMNDVSKGSESTKDYVVHPLSRVPLASNPNENVSATVRSVSSKPSLVSLSSRQESSNTYTNKKHVPELQEPPQAKSATANSVDNSMVETAIPQTGSDNIEGANNATASDDPASCPKSLFGGFSSNELQDEAKEDSQFQQKTMSVMRGGEMVEVSYKVYIPKKAPALARRQLRR